MTSNNNNSIRSPRRRKMDEYYDIKLINQIHNISFSLKELLEYSRDIKFLLLLSSSSLSSSESTTTSKNIRFSDMQTIEFHEDCFVTELNEFFTTLQKSDRLNKYNLKFTVELKK